MASVDLEKKTLGILVTGGNFGDEFVILKLLRIFVSVDYRIIWDN